MEKQLIMLLLYTLVVGCKAQTYNYDDFIALESTHKIENEELSNSLKELIIDTNYYGEFEFEVIVINMEKRSKDYNICITVTDYKIFKNYRPDMFEKLKGYTRYANKPVLLFGDVDDSFYKDLNKDFYDVVGNLIVYTKDNPPSIYDPKIICFAK
jgi:hypothetical protein